MLVSLQWRHNECDVVSNHRRLDCLLSRLFRHRSKKTSKLRITGLCEGNPSVTGGFPLKGPLMLKMFPFYDAIMWCQAEMNKSWFLHHMMHLSLDPKCHWKGMTLTHAQGHECRWQWGLKFEPLGLLEIPSPGQYFGSLTLVENFFLIAPGWKTFLSIFMTPDCNPGSAYCFNPCFFG